LDLVALVERARAGDVDAFTERVRRHQGLALGSAVALLRDPDLARDVVQETFVAAWRGLAQLTEPKACLAARHSATPGFHVLRARHLEPLAEAEHLTGDTLPVDQRMEARRRRVLALSALVDLPDGLSTRRFPGLRSAPPSTGSCAGRRPRRRCCWKRESR
jgi:DNA-directed RNA polymerase specialized sigma24 family protein